MTEQLLKALLDQAWMFDDPRAYEAGVRDTWDAWNRLVGAGDRADRADAA